MKQKIEEAITQGYKNLGVPKPVIDGLTALGLTVVKDESEIAAYVQGEAVKGVMRTFQSETDKVRTEYSAKIKGLESEKAELEAKLNGNNPETKPEPTPKDEVPSWAQTLIEANNAQKEYIKTLSDKIADFEEKQAQKSAVAALDELKATWDYAKGYPTECEDAYERVMELYEVGGKKWTSEELTNKFKEKFNKAVGRKGVDTSKPFESDGGGKSEPDFKAMAERLKAKGKIAVETADQANPK